MLFGERLRAAAAGAPSLAEALRRMGPAYLAFAREEPAYFAAMFEGGPSPDAHPDLREAGERAFGILRAAADAVVREAPPERRPPAAMLALHVWSMAHGIASLFGRGDGTRRRLPMEPGELLEAGLLVYLDGLGLRPGSKDS